MADDKSQESDSEPPERSPSTETALDRHLLEGGEAWELLLAEIIALRLQVQELIKRLDAGRGVELNRAAAGILVEWSEEKMKRAATD